MLRNAIGSTLLAGLIVSLSDGAAPPPRESPERAKLRVEAERLDKQQVELVRQGYSTEAAKVSEAALRLRETLYPSTLFPEGHADLATNLNQLGILLKELGELKRSQLHYEKALEIRQKLFSPDRFPEGHPDLAGILNNVGSVTEALGEPARALPYYEKSLAMYQKVYPPDRFPDGHPDLASALNNLANVYQTLGQPAKAVPFFEMTLAMRLKLFPSDRFPNGHTDLASSMNNLGGALLAIGEPMLALPHREKALAMRLKLFPVERFPNGHPDLATSLNNVGSVLLALGEPGRALPYCEKTLAMTQKLYPPDQFPNGHPYLASSLDNMGLALHSLGEPAQALPYREKALTMRQKLYPPERFPAGHPQLVVSLNNVGGAYHGMGEPARALPYQEKALAMFRRLIPPERLKDGHPYMASSLANLGGVLNAMGEHRKALPYCEQALAMRHKLYPPERYPKGHPELSRNLYNLGETYLSMNEPAQALIHFEKSHKMAQDVFPAHYFPSGHPDLASSLNGLGRVRLALGQPTQALPHFEKSLAMYNNLATAAARFTSEAQALDLAASFPLSRDAYLSLTRGEHGRDAYPLIWQIRGSLSQVYERRHLAALAAADPKVRALFDDVVQFRKQRERLILALAPADARRRDEKLADLDRRIAEKDRELLARLPQLATEEHLAQSTPDDLRKVLPKGAVFLDLLRYFHGEGKKGTSRTPHYLAFIVLRDRIERAELGPAAPIENAILHWRQAIQTGADGEKYAQTLGHLVWQPLAKHLPPGTTKVYLAPDMALSTLPWPALPGEKPGTVLLENHALCLVPRGSWLLGRLTAPPDNPASKPTLLALGGVAYDSNTLKSTTLADLRSPTVKSVLTWAPLRGTEKEADQISRLATGISVQRLTGEQANCDAVLKALPGRHYAHLATHGFFADPEFRSVLQVDEKLFDQRGMERVGPGARSPMVLSGLVCAGANRPETPNRGIVTADAISLLDLRQMRLAVLSACETGLGETAGGEGVYGLQRAFHIGGCRNVVASMWKVEDEATAALMTRFYAYLWRSEKKLSPDEALRQAQLDVYRNPHLIKAWAAERGLGKMAVAVPYKPGDLRSQPRAWAAWVLSGPGN